MRTQARKRNKWGAGHRASTAEAKGPSVVVKGDSRTEVCRETGGCQPRKNPVLRDQLRVSPQESHGGVAGRGQG